MQRKLKPIIATALLAAMATALFFFEIPLFPPPASFLKLDFSDIPALLAALLFGPVYGIAAELIKNLLLLTRGIGSQLGFGNIMNFIVGTAFILPFSLILRRSKAQKPRWKALLLATVVSMVSIALVGLGMNAVIMPLFFRYFLHSTIDVMPFLGFATILNVVKGALLSVTGIAMLRLPAVRGVARSFSGGTPSFSEEKEAKRL